MMTFEVRFRAFSMCQNEIPTRGFPFLTLYDGNGSVGPVYIAGAEAGMEPNNVEMLEFSNSGFKFFFTVNYLFFCFTLFFEMHAEH